MKTIVRACLLAAGLAAGGCAGATYRIAVETPDLVYAAPGVQVIANYDESIFYADGFYWWYYGNVWYRSPYYTHGWVYVASPPRTILRIDRPHAYRHYRPTNYQPYRRPVPARNIRRPVIRDHRARR